MIEFKKEYITRIWTNIKKKLTASNITFSDGETFQTKYDDGKLTGSQGPKGNDGTSITGVKQTTTSTADGGTNVVTVSLSNGTSSTFQVKNGSKGSNGTSGTNGKDGITPTIKAGTVTTGNAGTNASVTANTSGTITTFDFTIPRGTNGTNGTNRKRWSKRNRWSWHNKYRCNT